MGTRVVGGPPLEAGTGQGPDATSMPMHERGTRLGRYTLLARIATGGMAQVWVAEQAGDYGFRKLVAVKMIRPEMASDPTFRRMFLEEAQLASRLRHANVVEVLDLGDEQGTIYQVMTLIDGASLAALQRRVALLCAHGSPPMPLGIALRITCDVLRGLQAAHVLQDDDGRPLRLVHRDVSPENVLVGVDGVAKLADFGIARALGRLGETTKGNRVHGKLRYIAPEQLDGQAASLQSDLFSSGVVLWELLVGRPLFSAPTGAEGFRPRDQVIADPRQLDPRIPERVAAVTVRALALRPGDRFPSARAMIDALEAAAPVATHESVATFLNEQLGEALSKQRERVRRTHHGEAPCELVPDLRSSAIVEDLAFAPTVTAELPGDGTTMTIPPVHVKDNVRDVEPPALTPPRTLRASKAWVGVGVAAAAWVLGALAYVGFEPSAERTSATTPPPLASVSDDRSPLVVAAEPVASSAPPVVSSAPKPKPKPRGPTPPAHATTTSDPGARF